MRRAGLAAVLLVAGCNLFGDTATPAAPCNGDASCPSGQSCFVDGCGRLGDDLIAEVTTSAPTGVTSVDIPLGHPRAGLQLVLPDAQLLRITARRGARRVSGPAAAPRQRDQRAAPRRRPLRPDHRRHGLRGVAAGGLHRRLHPAGLPAGQHGAAGGPPQRGGGCGPQRGDGDAAAGRRGHHRRRDGARRAWRPGGRSPGGPAGDLRWHAAQRDGHRCRLRCLPALLRHRAAGRGPPASHARNSPTSWEGRRPFRSTMLAASPNPSWWATGSRRSPCRGRSSAPTGTRSPGRASFSRAWWPAARWRPSGPVRTADGGTFSLQSLPQAGRGHPGALRHPSARLGGGSLHHRGRRASGRCARQLDVPRAAAGAGVGASTRTEVRWWPSVLRADPVGPAGPGIPQPPAGADGVTDDDRSVRAAPRSRRSTGWRWRSQGGYPAVRELRPHRGRRAPCPTRRW